MENIHKLSLAEVARLIKEKEVSPVEVTSNIIDRAKTLNENNRAFITLFQANALKAAKDAETSIMLGNYRGPLHGIPISIKDNIPMKDTTFTNGSALHKDFKSQNDALLVQKLKDKGSVIVGKTNLDEFANNVIGKNKYFGTIKNPLNKEFSAGGSSGGSAASVSSYSSYASVGTDTSGSVRIPAASCGIVGLKPTYNLIPTTGITPLSWSLDHVGLLARDCDDLSILFNSITPGFENPVNTLNNRVSIKNFKIGIPNNYFSELIDETSKKNIMFVIDFLRSEGATIKHLYLPDLNEISAIQEEIIGSESAYFHKHHLKFSKTKIEDDNYNYFSQGLTIKRSNYFKALEKKNILDNQFKEIFTDVDILITPTLPISSPRISSNSMIGTEKSNENIITTLSRFTGPFNLNGLPALTVPVGLDNNDLSSGLQIIGSHFTENLLLSIGKLIMYNTK